MEDPTHPAEFPLKPQPHQKNGVVKVVVLTSSAPDLPADVKNVERTLAFEFNKRLQDRCTEHKEKVVVVSATEIENYKKKNPDWVKMSPVEIGKSLEADYLIDIEVLSMSLFEEGSGKEFLRGRSQISVTAFDLSKKLSEPAFSPPECNFLFPLGHPEAKFDVSISQFRQAFIRRIAEQLVVPYVGKDARNPADAE